MVGNYFQKEPEIQFQVQTIFEGRKLPQLASLITNQVGILNIYGFNCHLT